MCFAEKLGDKLQFRVGNKYYTEDKFVNISQ